MHEVRERSFMKALFHGVIAEDLILPFPEVSAEQLPTVRNMVRSLQAIVATHVDARAVDREQRFSQETFEALREVKAFGLTIPEEYGGLGLGATAYARVMQELGSLDPSLAMILGAHHSMGVQGLLMVGTNAQKQRFLPTLASGKVVAAFALTEPGAGSDAASIATRAELALDGEGYLVNGTKIWITNGGVADLFTVFARTSPLESGRKPGVTALLVERGRGVKSGPEEGKLGVRGASTTALYLEDALVPSSQILGEVGRGFRIAMEVLNSGRLGLSAACLGGCRRLVGMAVERARDRHAFGRPVGSFGMVKEKIARMMCETFALESMVYLTTGLVDGGIPDYSLESAICKIFGSETYWNVAHETAQIAAGLGYMTAYPYERTLRDARVHLVFAGTNEILRAFVALAGMQSPGARLQEVSKAMREPIKGFGVLGDFAIRRARTALGRERLSRVHPVLRAETVMFEELTGMLGRETERVLRKHGKDIAEMQFVQRRIAESAIDLYALAAVLARTTRAIEKRGEEGARRQIELSAGFAAIAGRRMRSRLGDMERDSDELLKHIADRTYPVAGYGLDVLS